MSTVTSELDRSETAHSKIEPAQHTAAKVVGFLYLIQMALGVLGESYLRGRVIVHGDAAQTALNIVASERLYRLSLVTDLMTYGCVIIMLWALYVVLKPVDRNVVLLGVFLRLVENSILTVITLCGFAELALLSGADYLQVFDAKQLQALVYTLYRVHGAGFNIGFVFLGLGSAVFSYVWFKSRYIPRLLAAWGIFSSVVLTLVTLVVMVFPTLGAALGLTYMLPMGVYEVGLGLWLLVKGIQAPIPQADSNTR